VSGSRADQIKKPLSGKGQLLSEEPYFSPSHFSALLCLNSTRQKNGREKNGNKNIEPRLTALAN
jgi:hypothetical protein